MSADIRLDAANELVLVDGDLSLVVDSEAVAQDVRTALRLGLGEWFLSDDGLDLKKLLTTKQNDAVVLGEVRRVAVARAGVTGILNLAITRDYASRTARVTFVLLTTGGRSDAITVSVGG